MLIPRFSIRWLLIVTAFVALFFAVVSAAVRGIQFAILAENEKAAQSDPGSYYHTVEIVENRSANPAFAAAGLSIGVGVVAVTGVVFAGFFLAAWLAAQIASPMHASRGAVSPFAQHTPAPQLLPPEEPVT